MHWDYKSKFYGKDILSKDFTPRALIGNYQKLGLYQNGTLTMPLPNKTAKAFRVDKLELTSNNYTEIKPDENDLNDTVGYYQSASYFYKHKLDRYTHSIQ